MCPIQKLDHEPQRQEKQAFDMLGFIVKTLADE